MNVSPLNSVLNAYSHLGAALKADLHAAPKSDEGPMTANVLAAQLEKSPEWVWAVMRGELVPGVRDLVAWEKATGGFIGIQWLCAPLGLLVLPYPSCEGAAEIEALLALSNNTEFVGEVLKLYADGIDRNDAAQKPVIEGLCHKTIYACVGLLVKFSVDAARAVSGRKKTMAAAEPQKGGMKE